MAHLLIQHFENQEGTTYAIAPETDIKSFAQRIFVAHPPNGKINEHQERALVCLLMGVASTDGFTWEFVE